MGMISMDVWTHHDRMMGMKTKAPAKKKGVVYMTGDWNAPERPGDVTVKFKIKDLVYPSPKMDAFFKRLTKLAKCSGPFSAMAVPAKASKA